MVPAEQEVLSSRGQRPDGVLHKVVINTEAAVVHIAAQSREQRQRVADGFSDAAVLRTAGRRLIHPLLELEDNRIGFLLALHFQRVAGDAGLLRLVFDVI